MNTTLNIQHSALSSREYTPPHLTIVEFKVEHCFLSGGERSTQSFMDKLGLTLGRRDDDYYYSTGEDFSEYSTNDGAFSSGGWI